MNPSPHGGLDWTSGNHARRLPFPFPLPEICENETLHFVSSHQLGSCGPSPFPFSLPVFSHRQTRRGLFRNEHSHLGETKKLHFLLPFSRSLLRTVMCYSCDCVPPKKSRISVVSSGGESSVGLEFFFPPLDQASKSGQTRFPPPPPPLLTRLTHKSTAGKRKSANTSFPSARKKSASRIRIFRTLSAKVEEFLFALSVCGKTPSSHFFLQWWRFGIFAHSPPVINASFYEFLQKQRQ